MDATVKRDVGTYRLMFFQPDPEDGDRVCVGVLLQEGRSCAVLYDKRFPKVHCIAPGFEPELVKFYLDDLATTLQRNCRDDLALTLRRYAPQLVASEERSILLPVTELTKMRLLERFVRPRSEPRTADLETASTLARQGEQFTERLRLLVGECVRPTEATIFQNARPQEIFGRALPDVRPVAISVKRGEKITLIDGVDLQIMNGKRARERANQVAYTFWQYGRARSEDSSFLWQTRFTRVGVVLNGSTHKTSKYYATHDYVLHQFQKDADLAIDAASGEDAQKLRAALAQETQA
ncbi:MAG TPA: hypothetical protein VMT20_17155 [Terriglobia bacterium]|nr:hypothetical protein [Terriglobia bacterium]